MAKKSARILSKKKSAAKKELTTILAMPLAILELLDRVDQVKATTLKVELEQLRQDLIQRYSLSSDMTYEQAIDAAKKLRKQSSIDHDLLQEQYEQGRLALEQRMIVRLLAVGFKKSELNQQGFPNSVKANDPRLGKFKEANAEHSRECEALDSITRTTPRFRPQGRMIEVNIAYTCLADYGHTLPTALVRSPIWQAIRHYACELFGHAEFGEKTLQRLSDWMIAEEDIDKNAFLMMKYEEVLERLKEGGKLKRESQTKVDGDDPFVKCVKKRFKKGQLKITLLLYERLNVPVEEIAKQFAWINPSDSWSKLQEEINKKACKCSPKFNVYTHNNTAYLEVSG